MCLTAQRQRPKCGVFYLRTDDCQYRERNRLVPSKLDRAFHSSVQRMSAFRPHSVLLNNGSAIAQIAASISDQEWLDKRSAI